MFELNKNYKGGLYCDGLADMLAIFLQCMGYDAYRVNLNVYENTHCVTVVKYGEGWLIEDATFNYTYVLKDKKTYDLKTLIYDLKYDGGRQVVAVEGKNIESYALSLLPKEKWTSLYPITSFVGREKERYMYKIDRRVIYYSMYEMMYPYFIENGYEADYKFSLLYAEDIIWKYGVEDLLFDKKETQKDIGEISAIMM